MSLFSFTMFLAAFMTPLLYFLPTVILGLITHLMWVYRLIPDAAPSALGWIKGVTIAFVAFLTPIFSYYASQLLAKKQNRHLNAPSVFLPILVASIQTFAFVSFTLYIRATPIEWNDVLVQFGYGFLFLSIANLTRQMYAHILFENGRKAYLATATTLTLCSFVWIIPLHFFLVILFTVLDYADAAMAS